jgi:hypothetical protein
MIKLILGYIGLVVISSWIGGLITIVYLRKESNKYFTKPKGGCDGSCLPF